MKLKSYEVVIYLCCIGAFIQLICLEKWWVGLYLLGVLILIVLIGILQVLMAKKDEE